MNNILKCLDYVKHITSLNEEYYGSFYFCLDSNMLIDNLERLIDTNPDFCSMIGERRRNALIGIVSSADINEYEIAVKRIHILKELETSKKKEEKIRKSCFLSGFYSDDLRLKTYLNNIELFASFIENAYSEVSFLLNYINGNELYDSRVLSDRKTFPETMDYILQLYPDIFNSQELEIIKEIIENETYSSRKNMSFSDRLGYISSKKKALRTINNLDKEKVRTKTLL